MNDDIKWTPGGDPTGGDDAALELQQALADPELAQNVRLRLEVSGGAHGERYDLHFDSTGDGRARIALTDEMTDRRYETRTVTFPPDTIKQLFNQIDVSAVVAYARANVLIPPCSLVGRLEISYGDRTFSTVFMADDEQARTAGYRLPPQTEHVINEIYELTAKQIGTDNIRP
ncbi:MAG: hypothetical protein H0U18_16935 [Pyrinomonadaceae bacterium]|nr:hypothetical protein [Pyrinomonadaceae bacterium]